MFCLAYVGVVFSKTEFLEIHYRKFHQAPGIAMTVVYWSKIDNSKATSKEVPRNFDFFSFIREKKKN